MKIKKIFISFLVLFSSLFSTQVFAAGTISVSTKGPMLASVGVGDYSIVSQENNKVVISFNLFNQGEVQTGIKYGIKLVKEINKSQFLADEKVYDESLTLLSGANLKKEITYIAPSNLDGEYTILLTSRNEGGMVFGMSNVGKIKLVSSVKGIVISPESCRLSIPGEKNKYIKYSLLEGVDISVDENLQLNCNAINTDSKSITATPSFETHFRTVYGDVVPHTDVANTPITFNPGEKKDISILLPKALKPQAYDLKVSLKYGIETSNTIVAHYVIQGVSATIQNLSLDKDFYEKGETAQMFFSWSQSADSFPGSRLGKASTMPEVYINAKITNKYGLSCTDPIRQLLPTDHNTLKNDMTAPIKRTCVNPKISISLVDKDGNVLDKKDFNVETGTREKSPIKTNIIIAGIILALVIVLILVYLKNKKGKDPEGPANPTGTINIPVAMFTILFTLVSVGMNFPLSKSEAQMAYQMAVNGGGGGGSGGTTVTSGASTGTTYTGLSASISSPKSSYDPYDPNDPNNPNSSIQLDTYLYFSACTNTTRNIYASGRLEGIAGTATAGYVGPTVELFNTLIHGLDGNTQTSYITAPTTPGDYTLRMEIKGYSQTLLYNAYLINNPSVAIITSSDFETLKEGIVNYVIYNYPEMASSVYSQIMGTPTVEELNIIINQSPISLSASPASPELVFTREYFLTPVQVRGVDVTVNDSKSPTVPYGGSATIKWKAINPTYGCKCTFTPLNGSPTFCGLSEQSNNDTNTSYTVNGVSANTTFNVSCKDVVQTQ